jgi:hypothetical protein
VVSVTADGSKNTRTYTDWQSEIVLLTTDKQARPNPTRLAFEVDAVAESAVELLLERVLAGHDVGLLGLQGGDALLQGVLLLLAIYRRRRMGGEDEIRCR